MSSGARRGSTGKGPSQPLRFRPIFKEKVWGGRRLETILGKKLPGPGPYGECWEIAALGGDSTEVDGGPWDGIRLDDLVRRHPLEILGRPGSEFPLLFKTIDASRDLSVQLHPGAEDAGGDVRPKTEAWVILHADPGARIVRGLTDPSRRQEFFDLAERGDPEAAGHLLARKEVRRGDVIYLPAGTIHSIGGGILLLEVQQSSDTTYRIHDGGHAGLDGKPRDLHLREARAVRARPPDLPCPIGSVDGAVEPAAALLSCPPFRLVSLHLGTGRGAWRSRGWGGPAGGFAAIAGIRGRARIRTARGDEASAGPGDFLLVPAAAGEVEAEAAGSDFAGLWVVEGQEDAAGSPAV